MIGSSHTILQNRKLDIRLEVLLAELVGEHISIDDVVIRSNSVFKRNYHHDIEKAEEIAYGQSREKKLHITVNRDGLYDSLPEDLFHQPSGRAGPAGNEWVIAEMKTQTELERSARHFFLPYEQEFYRQRIRLEEEEKEFLFETNSDLSARLLDRLWALPDFLNGLQKSKLGALLPVIHHISGDWELITEIVKSITGDQMSLRETAPLVSLLPDTFALGSAQLGVTSLLGGKLVDMQPAITITVSLQKPEELDDYMPGGEKMRLCEFLFDLLMPLESHVRYELELPAAATGFELGKETSWKGRLNYTTVL